MRVCLFILFLSGTFVHNISMDTPDWRKIEPLKTARPEVERILGQASGAYEVLYQLKDGRLSIEYSSGPCRPDGSGAWDVAENVVISVHFSPKKRKKISEMKLDLAKLRKVVDGHLPGFVYYIDDDAGITYTVDRGKLQSVEYGPAKKYDHLECKKQSDDAERNPRSKPLR